MDQSVESLGIPNQNRAAPVSHTHLSDAAYLAFLTGLIYLIAGAYQQGYQDVFGFSYISLGVEDIIDVFRKFIVSFIFGACVALVVSFVMMAFRKTSREDRLSNVFVAILPASLGAVFYLTFGWSGHWSDIDKLMFWILPLYYFFDPVLWGLILRRFSSTEFAVPLDRYFRLAQLGVASLLLILVAYNVGLINALNGSDQSLCPDVNGRQSILVGQSKDLLICAETDLATRRVYQNISYMRVPDSGSAIVLKTVKFVPEKIGPDDRAK